MQNFVHRQNLGHYVELLDTMTEPALRETVQALLIEEENRFGTYRERLDQTEDLIRQTRRRLEAQKVIIEQLAHDGHHSQAAEQLHENTQSTLEVFLQYQRILLDGADRPAL